jgi:hypothetical protein
LVRVVVHKKHHTLSLQDHGCEGRPVADAHGDDGGFVGVLHQPGLFNEGNVCFDRGVVAVFEEDGYDVVRVCGDPGVDFREVGGDGSCV